jgi:AraC-like DNA-binding protein
MGTHCLEDMHHFYKGGLSFASMNSEKTGMKQPSVYLTAKTPLPQYLPYARFLLNAELTHTAKLLYTLLLDRATLSQKNNWVDTTGRVYVLYPIAHLARDLHCSRSSITRAFTELENSGLLERLHSGFSKPSRILPKVPQNVQKYPSMLCTGASSDGAKVTSMDVQNCIPNHLNRNQQKYNYKQKQKNTQGFPEFVFEEGESL